MYLSIHNLKTLTIKIYSLGVKT